MPTIAQIDGIRIVMYYEDHEPAHFHVRGAAFRAKFAVLDLTVLELVGRLRPQDSALIRRWGLTNKAELLENWRRARRGEQILKLKEAS
jgi:hypothetical protein